MKEIKRYFNNPYLWGACTLLALSLTIVGWAESYPVNLSPLDVSVLDAVFPIFWVGLCLGFVGLTGLVLTSRSKYVHWISSCLLVLFLTSPHFLYLSWGSDAGGLPNLVDYIRDMRGFDMQRDVAANSYFQWPLGIFFHQFLADMFSVDVYAAALIGFLFVLICVGGGLFMLWYQPLHQEQGASAAVFWGFVVYFAGSYWLLNWQAVPYVFFLALLFPALTLLDVRTLPHRILFLLLFSVGIEAHALFGVWIILIAGALLGINFAIGFVRGKKDLVLSLILLMMVTQISIIIFKNLRFFYSLVRNLQGYYQALLTMGASDKSLSIQAQRALSPLPSDLVGSVLKVLSWLDLGFVGCALGVAVITVVLTRRLRVREIVLIGVGIIHFTIGTQYMVIGTRAIQLIALAVAFFVVDSIVQQTKASKVVLIASLAGLMLFPAPIVRSHQSSPNYVKPIDLYFAEAIERVGGDSLTGVKILSEHIRPLSIEQHFEVLSTRHIRHGYVQACSGPVLLVDTVLFRQEMEQLLGETPDALSRAFFDMPVFYDSGAITLRFVEDCSELGLFDLPEQQ